MTAGKPHVLIVEDEEKIARVLCDYMRGANYTATHLDRGDVVLDWLADNSPDLILLDLMLPLLLVLPWHQKLLR